jgi:anti-sigma B factor antagonist
MGEQPLDVSIHHASVGTVVVVRGELDMLTAPGLDADLRHECAHPGRPVFVDLAEVEFLGAAGVNTLVGAYRVCRREARGFTVVNPSPAVLRAFKAAAVVMPVGSNGMYGCS